MLIQTGIHGGILTNLTLYTHIESSRNDTAS